jgi:hypothetical protein
MPVFFICRKIENSNLKNQFKYQFSIEENIVFFKNIDKIAILCYNEHIIIKGEKYD